MGNGKNFIRGSKTPTVFGIVVFVVAIAYGGTVFASHSFEAGVKGDTIPDNTHIRLDGMTLPAGGVFPLYDSSPNFVSGHFLLTAPCEPVSAGDDTYRPTVTVIAGHIDELDDNTYMESIPLFYINTVNNAPDFCVWHAHIPDPLNGGAPRVTDIDLINLSGEPITFSPGHVVDINIQQVLGSIGDAPYENGPDLTGVVPNPIFDLNDDDETNDGLGHASQVDGGGGH